MAARTGDEFLQGLRENPPELYLQGERVKDPTTHGGLSNGVHTLARLYEMQHDPELRDVMTYVSPSSGERVGLSFIVPRTQSDLERRRAMMTQWAKVSCGMMGRTPDFLNVSFMAMAEASGYFSGNRPQFAKNVQDYYEYIRENDLVLTHTLINLQRSRQPSPSGLDDTTDVALSVVKETDDGNRRSRRPGVGQRCRSPTKSPSTRRAPITCRQTPRGGRRSPLPCPVIRRA